MKQTTSEIYGDNLEPQKPIDAGILNQCPDALREDLHAVIAELYYKMPARELLEKIGVNCRGKLGSDSIDFHSIEGVSCSDLDDMVRGLDFCGMLNPGLRANIARLRVQFAGLYYYYLKMSELGVEDFDQGRQLLEEMGNCGRYPEKIHPSRDIFRQWMHRAANFEEAKQAYETMTSTKYDDGESGEGKLVCTPDEEIFDIWFGFCKSSVQYKEAYSAYKVWELNYDVPFSSWINVCVTYEDFYCLFEATEGHGSDFVPKLGIFVRWFNQVKSYVQFAIWIETLFNFGLVPDHRMLRRISRFSFDVEEGMSPRQFKLWLRDVYAKGENANVVASPGWGSFYQSAMRALP